MIWIRSSLTSINQATHRVNSGYEFKNSGGHYLKSVSISDATVAALSCNGRGLSSSSCDHKKEPREKRVNLVMKSTWRN